MPLPHLVKRKRRFITTPSRRLVSGGFYFGSSTFQNADQVGYPQFVRLWNSQTIANLENENRINELCPSSLETGQEACVKEKLKGESWNLELYDKPDNTSNKIGALIVTATPGKGLRYEFIPAGGKDSVPFVPDLFDSDWGYGPHSAHTVLKRVGDWVLLPADPFPGPVWVNLMAGFGRAHYVCNIRGVENRPYVYDPLKIGTVYELDGHGVVITEIREDGLLLRDEISSDMPCGDEEAAGNIVEPKAELFPWAKLYNGSGHFKLLLRYTRGC